MPQSLLEVLTSLPSHPYINWIETGDQAYRAQLMPCSYGIKILKLSTLQSEDKLKDIHWLIWPVSSYMYQATNLPLDYIPSYPG